MFRKHVHSLIIGFAAVRLYLIKRHFNLLHQLMHLVLVALRHLIVGSPLSGRPLLDTDIVIADDDCMISKVDCFLNSLDCANELPCYLPVLCG